MLFGSCHLILYITICQLNQLFSNSEAAMLSGIVEYCKIIILNSDSQKYTNSLKKCMVTSNLRWLRGRMVEYCETINSDGGTGVGKGSPGEPGGAGD